MGGLFCRAAAPSSPAPVPSPAPTPAKKTGGKKAEKDTFPVVAGFDTTARNIAQLKLIEPAALKCISTHFAASVVPIPRDLPGLTESVVFSWYRAGTSREDAQGQYRDILRIADQLEDRDRFTVRVIAMPTPRKNVVIDAPEGEPRSRTPKRVADGGQKTPGHGLGLNHDELAALGLNPATIQDILAKTGPKAPAPSPVEPPPNQEALLQGEAAPTPGGAPSQLAAMEESQLPVGGDDGDENVTEPTEVILIDWHKYLSSDGMCYFVAQGMDKAEMFKGVDILKLAEKELTIERVEELVEFGAMSASSKDFLRKNVQGKNYKAHPSRFPTEKMIPSMLKDIKVSAAIRYMRLEILPDNKFLSKKDYGNACNVVGSVIKGWEVNQNKRHPVRRELTGCRGVTNLKKLTKRMAAFSHMEMFVMPQPGEIPDSDSDSDSE
eukprot:g16332.t1